MISINNINIFLQTLLTHPTGEDPTNQNGTQAVGDCNHKINHLQAS